MVKQRIQTTKPWYKSKVVLFNVLVAMGTAAEASLHIIANNFSPNAYFALIMAVAGINVVLRFISTTGISK